MSKQTTIKIAGKEFDAALVKEAVNGAADQLEKWPERYRMTEHWRVGDCL